MRLPRKHSYCLFAVAAAEVPIEFASVTVTAPMAFTSPEIENGIEMVNWLPKAFEAVLLYQVWKVFVRSAV